MCRVVRSTLVVTCLAAGPAAAQAPHVADALLVQVPGEVHVDPRGAVAAVVVERSDVDANRVDSSLWLVELASGQARVVPGSTGDDAHPRWSPDGRRLAFLARRGGPRAIWTVTSSGEAPVAAVRAAGNIDRFAWMPDGSGVVFTMRPRRAPTASPAPGDDARLVGSAGERARLYRQALGSVEPEPLTPETEHVDSFDVARGPDSRTRVVYTVQPSAAVRDGRLRSDLRLLDLQTREVRPLVSQPGMDRSPRFSPDGSTVAFVSMDGVADWLANFVIASVRIDGTGLTTLTKRFDERVEYHVPGNEQPFRWAPDGQGLYFVGHRGPANRLWTVDARGERVEPVSAWDAGKVVTSFDIAASGALLMVASDPVSAPELYLAARGAEPPRALTSFNAGYPRDTIAETEVFAYRASDGTAIDGLLVASRGRASRAPRPLLVIVHGGPMGLFDLGFAPRQGAYPVHAFASAGYLVFMPNPRGSGGYGERFRKAVVGDWGGVDFQDILAGIDRLIERGLADPGRLGLLGWSYGGFMTAWAITQTSRFKAASIGAPITELTSFWGTTDIPEFAEAYHGGPPWAAPEAYRRRSPMSHVSSAHTPTLLQQGDVDDRVPLAQGLMFRQALEARDVPVQMSVYPREGHLLREPGHLRHALEANLAWFTRWVRTD